jgi:hypothetical protein
MRERVPLDWASTQNNLGLALRAVGERDSGLLRLEEAVAAHGAALEELTRERVPLLWGRNFGNQGVALMHLAERRKDFVMAEAAALQIETALEIVRREHAGWTDFEARLLEAYRIRDALKVR